MYSLSQRCAEHRINALTVFMRDFGDAAAYIATNRMMDIHAPIHHEMTRFTVLMAQWFLEELNKIKAIKEKKENAIVISLLSYGEKYVQRLEELCLSSLAAEGNIPGLMKEREVIFAVHTDEKNVERVKQAFSNFALPEPVIWVIPESLIEGTKKDLRNRFWFLGAAQSLHLMYAKAMGADFSMAFPDHVYADGFYGNMLGMVNSGIKAVMFASFRTDITTVKTAVDARRDVTGVLSIPPSHLTAIGLNCLHIWENVILLNNRTTDLVLPQVHRLEFESNDSLTIVCPHLNLGFLSREIIERIPYRYFNTLDSEIDKLIQPHDVYTTPQLADNMATFEVSDPQTDEGMYADYNGFRQRFWGNNSTKRALDFFKLSTIYPVDNTLRENALPWKNERIERELKSIRAMLDLSCPFQE